MTDNITIDKGGSNSHTVYATKIEEVGSKIIPVYNYPSTVQEYSNGPKEAKILDLLRFKKRINIDGWIDISNITKFRNIIKAGGTFVLEWAGIDYTVNMEKYTITESPEDSTGTEAEFGGSKTPDHLLVKFSVVEGENLI